MRCPLCNETIANDSELQLHYLLSCSAYATTRAAEDLPATARVRFRWAKARPCIEEEIHLISSLAGFVILRWNESEGLFESELTNTPVGQHLCQLVVSGDVLPTEDFVISAESDVIYIILTQDDFTGDIPDDPVREDSLTGDSEFSRDELQARIASPLHNRRDELTLDIDSHHSEEHDSLELSPLYKELLRHQVIHGEPSWVPGSSGHDSSLLSEEVGSFLSRSSVRDPPLLTTEPAYLADLRRRSPVPVRPHGVEITTDTSRGQEEAEMSFERLGSAGERVRLEQNDALTQELVGDGRRSSTLSSSSSHSAASSTQSSARPSPVNSNPDDRESSVGSPFLEEQLLPQSRGSPESPLVDKDMVPKGANFVVEIVGVERTLSAPSSSQVGVEHSSPVLHLVDGHVSSDVADEEVARSHHSTSRASPLGSVLDEAGISNGVSASGTGADLDPTPVQPAPFEQEPETAGRLEQPSLSEQRLHEVAPGESPATRSPPGRTSPTGSAFTDSERFPGGTSPFTSPRVRSHSDINPTLERMSPPTSLHSEPQLPLQPQPLERDRTRMWRTGPYRGDAAPERSRESLPDAHGRRRPAESPRRSQRESPAGSFRAESPVSSRTRGLSEGSNHSSGKATPPLDLGARPSSGERSGDSHHSSRASSIHAELRRSTESERSDSGEVAVTDSRSSLHDSRNSSTHTSPRTRTDGIGSPLATPTSPEVPLDDSGQSLHDRPSVHPGSARSGSRRSSGSTGPPTVPSSDEVPIVDSRQSLHDHRHDSHPEATRSGSRRSSGSTGPPTVPSSDEVPLVDSRQSLHDGRHDSHPEATRSGSKKGISRTGPVGAHVYGSNRSSRNQSPISQEVTSLLEILHRKEQKAKTPPVSVKSSMHQTPRLQNPPEVLRQVGLDGAFQSGPDRTSNRQSLFSSRPSRRHIRGAPEAAPSPEVPFIPSRGTAFQVVSDDRDPAVVASSAEMEALKRERDGLVQELKIRTAHFEQELRKMKTWNEDLEQQVLSVQMAASLSQDDDKQKETERSEDALKSAQTERETVIGRLEDREAEIGRLRIREEEICRQFQEKIEELEEENRLLKEEHESLKTVNQITMDDVSKVKADLKLELTSLRRSLRLSSHSRDQEQITRLKDSNGSLEHEIRELKRQLEKTKPRRTTTDHRLNKAKSETDLSAKYDRKYHDLPTRNGNSSLGTESSGLGSSPNAWMGTNNDVFYKYVDRSSALTNGGLSRHSVVAQSASPRESDTRRRFSSVGDESEISDLSDLDRSWPNGSRHRTISSESSTSSLFSAADHDRGTHDYQHQTNGYRSPRPYSPVDYGHSHATRRGQRPHSFHGDVGSLTDYYTKDAAPSTSIRHPRSTTSEGTPKIMGFNSSLYSARLNPERSRSGRHCTTDTKSYAREQLLKPFAPTSAGDIRVGSRVLVTRARGKIGRGVVKYVGSLPGRTDTYVGVELDQNEGKHDGSFDGQRFFKCKPNYGIFVSFNKVVMCYG